MIKGLRWARGPAFEKQGLGEWSAFPGIQVGRMNCSATQKSSTLRWPCSQDTIITEDFDVWVGIVLVACGSQGLSRPGPEGYYDSARGPSWLAGDPIHAWPVRWLPEARRIPFMVSLDYLPPCTQGLPDLEGFGLLPHSLVFSVISLENGYNIVCQNQKVFLLKWQNVAL